MPGHCRMLLCIVLHGNVPVCSQILFGDRVVVLQKFFAFIWRRVLCFVLC